MNRWGRRTVMCVMGCCILYAVGIKVFTSITAVYYYHLDIDTSFCPAVRQKIQETCATIHGGTLRCCYQCINQLRAVVPSIASCTVSLREPHTALVTVKAHKPFFVVNDSVCITTTGYAFESQQLADEAIRSLPTITVPHYVLEDSSLNHILCNWMHNSAPAMHTMYRTVWHDSTDIRLHPLDTTQCIIRCSYQIPPTEQLLATCAALYKKQVTSISSRAQCWIADIRFTHQIILKKENISLNPDRAVSVSQKS